jgi:hypothetical protein
MPGHRRDFTSPLKSKNTKFPTEGRKAVTCYSVGGTRKPASPRSSEAHAYLQENLISPKSWNPSSSTEWQSTTLQMLGGFTTTVHRDPELPGMTAGESSPPIKELEPQLPH